MKQNKLYERLPIFLKEFLLNLYACSLHRKRFGKHYKENLKFLRDSQWWNREQYELFQMKRLKEILLASSKHVPFYKERFSEQEIENIFEHSKTVREVLSFFPIVEKTTLKENIEAFTSDDPTLKTVGYSSTSGTTGMPLKVPVDQFTEQISQAYLRRFYDWMGLPEKFRSIRFSGNVIVSGNQIRPPFWVENKIRNQLFMSTYHISETTMPFYIQKIEDYKPSLLDGYPSAIGFIANYIRRNGIKLSFFPKAVATTAETLEDHVRADIETAFNCKVFNQYGSAEGAPLITECPEGSLHINPETGIIEFMNAEGNNAQAGEIAEMVITSFRNRKLPLIRYRIGDIAVLSKNQNECACGRKMPCVDRILGRMDDILYTPDGKIIGMVNYRIFESAQHVLKSQVVQKDRNRYLIKVIKDREYSKNDEENIFNRARLVFGENAHIEFEYLADIPLSANGKYKCVVNEWKTSK